MRTEILDKYPAADLRVFVVWFSMLPSDFRLLVDHRVLADPRAANFWDERRVVGRWFAQQVAHDPGITWDAYFLYGPEARWESVPAPLVSSGGTVIGQRRELQRDLQAFLQR